MNSVLLLIFGRPSGAWAASHSVHDFTPSPSATASFRLGALAKNNFRTGLLFFFFFIPLPSEKDEEKEKEEEEPADAECILGGARAV